MNIKEVYEKYYHLDNLISDKIWMGETIKDEILFDLWGAVKAEMVRRELVIDNYAARFERKIKENKENE